nr:ABC transporter ATP-binding protein [Kibdelosporangium sp. MJ126-NF4]CEL13038.1 ABC transporter ATP-binding protein [Kibdelosporangium sp. MJ126-NF4]CTQ98724.1 ABC transporter ATP-binding protein [Kibdelosporangium sp. MJ126-NF4]
MTGTAATPAAHALGTTEGAPLVRARNLVKRFGDTTAVDGIDVTIQPGEAFGFLGRNGAGKTSMMRMIGCVSPLSDGELTVLGMDPVRDGAVIRARLGVCPQEDNLDLELTARQNLTTYARYFRISRAEARRRADELLEFVQLDERATSKVEPLSGGMKRRLTIARALINDPAVVLLDEPTTGLDPQARHLVWERLFQLKKRGVTLVLTTHYMEEAEQLCDRLVIMDAGRIVAQGTPRSLIDAHCAKEVVELRFATDDLESYSDKLANVGDRVEVLPDRLLLYTDDGDEAVPRVYENGLRPSGVLVRRSGLEDVFLLLTGRTLGED